MKKTKFKSSYKDKHDGAKVKVTTSVEISDLTKDLGHEFLFIECEYNDSARSSVVHEQLSIMAKDIPKLINALKKVMK